jgi:hypothetical protein
MVTRRFDVRRLFRSVGEKRLYKMDLGNKLWIIENYQIKNVEDISKPIEEKL